MEESKADALIEAMFANAPFGLRPAKDALSYAVNAPSMAAAGGMEQRRQRLQS